jgi:hypothetical protein
MSLKNDEKIDQKRIPYHIGIGLSWTPTINTVWCHIMITSKFCLSHYNLTVTLFGPIYLNPVV